MVTSYILRRLKNHWVGPAIKLVVGKRSVVVGQGEIVATVIFNNARTVRKLLFSPSLALGEGYMSGNITIKGDMMGLFQGFFQSHGLTPRFVLALKKIWRYMPISVQGAVKNVHHHYDLGNDFYSLWLDSSKTYTCAYFLHSNDSLETAQFQKNDLICKKIRLEPGMTMLDIGCGWGAALFHAAQQYGAIVTGITPSKEQAAYILARAKELNIQDKVNVIVSDYRELPEKDKNTKYDRIISIGMFEHVGRAQFGEFFALWKHLLKDDGISLLHTIGRTDEENSGQDPWLRKYIFPGGYIPLLREITHGAGKEHLLVVDIENLWQHYVKTLHMWAQNAEAQKSEIVNMFDERFFRMWMLYLRSCEAGFTWGDAQLFQTVILGKDALWPLNREVTATLKKGPENV